MDSEGGPAVYVRNFDRSVQQGFLEGCSYRWTRGSDWGLFLTALQGLIQDEGNLKQAFERAWKAHESLEIALENIVQSLRRRAVEAHGGPDLPRGTRYFLVAPSGGSACKRWMLFLRGMCRPSDGVDLGLFEVPHSQLLIPLDTHVHRIGRFLGLTKRKDTTWKTAVALTKALRQLDPEDPTRFDFALAHVGISAGCSGVRGTPPCKNCGILDYCQAPTAKKRIGLGRS